MHVCMDKIWKCQDWEMERAFNAYYVVFFGVNAHFCRIKFNYFFSDIFLICLDTQAFLSSKNIEKK